MFTRCNVHLLALILRCMPNLQEFCFTFFVGLVNRTFNILLDGNYWQHMLTSHAPHLNKFDFHISFLMNEISLNLDSILNSFQYFVTQYDGWHMSVSQWKTFQGRISCK